MSDTHNVKTKEPSDGSSNWVEYRRLILTSLERIEQRQDRFDTKIDEILRYHAAQKAIVALVSLIFGTLGAGIFTWFKKGNTP